MTSQPDLFDDSSISQKPKDREQQIESIPLHKDGPGIGMLDLVPETALLELTRQFSIQPVHISKTLDLLHRKNKDGIRLSIGQIGDEFAYAKRHMEGILNVIRELELINSDKSLTPFGELVLGTCPYIDKPGLLWLFHYLLASNANLVVWSFLFNRNFYLSDDFTAKNFSQELFFLSKRWSDRTLNIKAPGEAGSILKLYTDGFLKPIQLIERTDKFVYSYWLSDPIIPPYIWLSALLVYRDRYYQKAPSLELPLIIDANFSPGRIFRQNSSAVRKYLDELHNLGLISVETRSGLDQVRFRRDITWLSAAEQYFKSEAR